ncbi:septum site-determining protein Ssd [Williamsia deligens]|uniref:Septum site-determining protein Ssd n=1 Tax=Williamsia deligens TaxID=321325 RepID=A0ABW3GB28_9NOCA|nr:septum site-determining protein Ssd [Williamsia deligens]MCP2193271.1 helicase/secretion neighborhood CpaE-like protein [Williamsia deligens]
MPPTAPAIDRLLAMVQDDLADDVARCAAAAGYRVVASDPDGARRAWSEAMAVVVDPTTAQHVADAGWPRRRGVVVVGSPQVEALLWRSAMAIGAEDAHLLPADEHAVVGTLSRLRAPRRAVGAAIAVVGGHGGAGASVLASATALRAAHDLGTQTLVVDLDDAGGGLDLVFGVEDAAGLRWPDLTVDSGQVFAESLHAALPRTSGGVTVLGPRRGSGHRVGVDAATAVLEASRSGGDVVIVDLSRRDDDVAHAVVEAADLVVVVTGATVRGCAATRSTVDRWRAVTERMGLVVRGPAPGGLTAARIASTVDVDLLAAVRSQPSVVAGLESGRLPIARRSPLGRAADAVLDRVLDPTGVAA